MGKVMNIDEGRVGMRQRVNRMLAVTACCVLGFSSFTSASYASNDDLDFEPMENYLDLAINYSSVTKDNIGGEEVVTVDESARGYQVAIQQQLWPMDFKFNVLDFFHLSFMPVGYFKFNENNFATISQLDFDYRCLTLGGGLRFNLGPAGLFDAVHLIPSLAFERLEQSTDGVQNGFSLRGESRVWLGEVIELNAHLAYLDFSLQNGFEIGAGMALRATQRITFVGGVEFVSLSSPSDASVETNEGDLQAFDFRLGLRADW